MNFDGEVNSTDIDDFEAIPSEGGNAVTPWDIDFDGSAVNTTDDETFFYESYNANTGFIGRGKVGSADTGNRKGYAGYEFDPSIIAYHVRHRAYLPEIGRWSRRDPIGYEGGISLYSYATLLPLILTDARGLCGEPTPPQSEPPSKPKDLSDEEACNAATGEKQWGVVVCYKGRKISCNFYPARKYFDPRIPDGTDLGNNITADCTRKHEDTHHSDVENCDKDRIEPYIPKWKPDFDQARKDREECEAHKAGLACAEARLSDCAKILKDAGLDVDYEKGIPPGKGYSPEKRKAIKSYRECVSIVKQFIEYNKGVIDEYCNGNKKDKMR